MISDMLFDGWSGPARTLIVGVMAYGALVLSLRLSGKRTLSKMNAFDLVVTVALGSTLATVLLNRSVPLIDGVMAFALLILAQYAITWLSVRSVAFRNVIKSKPRAVLANGRLLEETMRRERLTRDEVEAAVRSAGFADIGRVKRVVLETDGSLSVMLKDGA